ncbi:hypothetical protein [Paenibacillus sp. DYY-L-2]|uniref:hypothetical protein n=1 Tax=Paenibacillus sp. DYY-L-2 TaxID=3447013 RepID=UPI003F4FCA13
MEEQPIKDQFIYKDLRKRNQMICFMVSLTVGLTIFMLMGLHVGGWTALEILAPGLILVAVIWFLHLLKKKENWISMISVLGMFVISIIPVLQGGPSGSTQVSAFFVLSIGLMYNTPLVVWSAFGGGLLLLVISNAKGFSPDFSIFLFYFVLTSIILLVQSNLSRRMLNQANTLSKNASEMLAKELEREKITSEATLTISNSISEIRNNSHDNQHSFREMNRAFQEMASGIGGANGNDRRNFEQYFCIQSKGQRDASFAYHIGGSRPKDTQRFNRWIGGHHSINRNDRPVPSQYGRHEK